MKHIIIAAAALFPLAASAQIAGDEHWLYGYPDTSPEPFAMETIGDYIYMGGLFLSVDGVGNAKDFARFNLRTEVWEAIPGFGQNDVGGVWAIHAGPDGNVYVGGNFGNVDGTSSSGVACFSPQTQTWTSLTDASLSGGQENGPTNGRVLALTHSGDWLYVGGEFTGPSGTSNSEKYIRRFNLASREWDLAVGSGVTKPTDRAGEIRALLTLPDGSVLAGGNVEGGLVRWDGSTWEKYSDGVSLDGEAGVVRTIVRGGDGSIYVGGFFDEAGTGTVASNVARLLPSGQWDALAGGFDDQFIQSNGTDFDSDGVWELGLDGQGRVFAVGDFDAARGRTNTDLRHVAMWDDTGEWKNLGSGVGLTGSQNANCLTIGPGGNDLYVGGIFSSGYTFPNRQYSFVRWNDSIDFTGYVAGSYIASRSIRISAPTEDNRFPVRAQLITGVSYQFEYSENLRDWMPIGDPLVGRADDDGVPFLQGFNIQGTETAEYYRYRPVEDNR